MVVRIIDAPAFNATLHHDAYGLPYVVPDTNRGWLATVFSDRIGATFQFNVRSLNEGGRLQPIAVDPDGTPSSYRIVAPRQFILQASFDL